MSNFQLSMTYFRDFVRKKFGDFLTIWVLTSVLMIIPNLIFMLLKGQLIKTSTATANIFAVGIQNLESGATLSSAIPVPLMRELLIIGAINIFAFFIIYSFVQGGIAGYHISENKKNVVTDFFSAGGSNLGKMIGVNLLIAIILLLAVGIGFGLGTIVYVIANQIIFFIVLLVLVYVLIRFAFTSFVAVREKKTWLPAFFSSLEKTQKSTALVAGIVLISAILMQIFSTLTGNLFFVSEIIVSLIIVTQLSLLYPLYKKAEDKND